MEKEIISENINGEIIAKLYQLCSLEIDQAQALFDKRLKVTKLQDKTYHFSYLDKEFDFTIYKKRKEILANEKWILLGARKFLESYKMLWKFLEDGMFIVVGYVNSCQNEKKVLNCWLEEEKDGEVFVRDINRNLIMKKEDYEMLFAPLEIYRNDKRPENIKMIQKNNESK